MYKFQEQFKALDERIVEDPIIGARWTIRRDGVVEDGQDGGVPEGMQGYMKRMLAFESLSKKQLKALGEDGMARLIDTAADEVDLDKLMNSDRAISRAVVRVRNIDPIEVTDDATGETKRVPFSAEEARKILTLKDPVPPDLVERVLPLREDELPEGEEERAEAREQYKMLLRGVTTLGQLLRQWVLRQSEDTERFREGVIADAGEASGAGATTGPAPTKSSATTPDEQ